MTLADTLRAAGVPTADVGHRHGRAGWVQVDCPWCGRGNGKFHLGFNLVTGAAACWRCGPHNPAKALQLLLDLPYGKARGLVDGSLGDSPHQVRPQAARRHPKLPRHIVPLASSQAHLDYVRGRGLDPGVVGGLWHVEAIAQAPKLAWRLYIPIHHRGRVVSWTTRSIAPSPRLRYVSASADQEAVAHKSILYGADLAGHTVVVHEGPVDCWATGPGAVATLGTGWTPDQLLALSRYPVRVVCFDSSDQAQRRADNLADALAPFQGSTYVVRLDTGDDAAAADPDELAELRATWLV